MDCRRSIRIPRYLACFLTSYAGPEKTDQALCVAKENVLENFGGTEIEVQKVGKSMFETSENQLKIHKN